MPPAAATMAPGTSPLLLAAAIIHQALFDATGRVKEDTRHHREATGRGDEGTSHQCEATGHAGGGIRDQRDATGRGGDGTRHHC